MRLLEDRPAELVHLGEPLLLALLAQQHLPVGGHLGGEVRGEARGEGRGEEGPTFSSISASLYPCSSSTSSSSKHFTWCSQIQHYRFTTISSLTFKTSCPDLQFPLPLVLEDAEVRLPVGLRVQPPDVLLRLELLLGPALAGEIQSETNPTHNRNKSRRALRKSRKQA